MDAIETLRRFNRAYTQRIGVLSDSYLGAGRSLGPSRLLFELGDGPRPVIDLRHGLGLDSGYLSRMLGQLETDGLVAVERDPTDGRRRVARLTERGRREWRRLDQRSQRAAHDLLAPLRDHQRHELTDALQRADHLLRVATIRFERADIHAAEARWAIDQYFAELDERFPGGFDPGTGGADHDADLMSPPHGAFVVATSDRDVLGCGGVQRIDRGAAEIKRMWIHPDWRGDGLGRRLLADLESVARSLGHSVVVLDTNASLAEAIALYERTGYEPIERYNDNPYAQRWFRKAL